MNLDGLDGGAHCEFRAEQLGHRRFLAVRLALLREHRRVIREVLASLDFGGHVGQLERHALEVHDGLAELLPLDGIGACCLECALGDAE